VRDNDARKLTHNELTELRKRGVKAVQDGQSVTLVAKVLGIQQSTLFGWLARYRQGGWGALDAHKRGGRPSKLTAKMIAWIYDTVARQDPRQLEFPFALWTSHMVVELVWRQFHIRFSKASVCRLMNQLGLSPQKPLWRAFQQDPQRVNKWIMKEYPRIQALAKEQKADIFFGDEAGVRSDFHAGKTWAVKGQTPIVTTTGARFGCNLISAVSPKGAMRFIIVEGKVNNEVFIDFLKRLIHNWPRNIILILDGHPVHKAVAVSQFVASTNGRLRIFYLPPYSPELNPDEQVWNHLKNQGVGKASITGPDQLKKLILSKMRKIQKLPSLVSSFFMMPDTVYAMS
jgi:transposase